MADHNCYDRKGNNTTGYQHPNESNLYDVHKAMDYDSYGRPVLRVDDTSQSISSKGRQKISTFEVLFFSTFQFDKDLSVWDEVLEENGSADFDPILSNVALKVNGVAGSKVIRQTRRTMQYYPGRSNTASTAIRFGQPALGIRRRIGAFDELNGFYLEEFNNNLTLTIRRQTSATETEETRATQSEWNIDRMDGTGPSGINLDMTKQQTIEFEYDWYGSGAVLFRVTIDNINYEVHQFNHANVIERTWTSTPFLPIRVELENVTGESDGEYYIYHSSTSLAAEGDTGTKGKLRNAATPIQGKEISLENPNVFTPVISIRLRPETLNGIAEIAEYQISSLANDVGIFYRWTLGTSITRPEWEQVEGFSSIVEYDVESPASAFGTVLKTGFNPPGQGENRIPIVRDHIWQLPRGNLGTEPVILTLEAAAPVVKTLVYADVIWREIR